MNREGSRPLSREGSEIILYTRGHLEDGALTTSLVRLPLKCRYTDYVHIGSQSSLDTDQT